MRRKAGAGLAVVVAALCAAAPAAAQWDPETAAALFAKSRQKGIDQMANPDYGRRAAPPIADFAAGQDPDLRAFEDPYRLDWGCADIASPADCVPRGREIDVRIENRYDVPMFGHLSLPHELGKRKRPAVIMLNGGRGSERGYRGLAQGLAEAGYVVLGLDVQGDGRSPAVPTDPRYCQAGEWQQPQEMGLREPGPCAGQVEDPAPGPGDVEFFADAADDGAVDNRHLQPAYDAHAPRKVFGALDAVVWLLSDANPVRRNIDVERIGIAGHSLGAHGALLAANGDEHRRFRAAVSLDGFGQLNDTVAPTVPTMFQHGDAMELAPPSVAPPRRGLPGHVNAEAFRAAGVDTATVVFSGTTHQDFNYIPYVTMNPLCPGCGASRDGERRSLYYMRAWFDRYLGRTGSRRNRAAKRLFAGALDASVDRSSIGQGPYDLATQSNQPPTIAGQPASEALTPLFDSGMWSGKLACEDLRAGCG